MSIVRRTAGETTAGIGGNGVKLWNSCFRAGQRAVLLALPIGLCAVQSWAADSAAPAAPASTQENAKIALPSTERPLVITITPGFSKAIEGFKTETKPAAPALKPDLWTPQQVAAAKARCAAILKKIHAVAVPKDPVKQGACGAPAPVQLISIGKSPEVSLSPPATLSCEMAEALSRWVEGDLQPLARKHLHSQIIKIEVMSSYSCRNAYGRKHTKLSEHGLANALDIRGFVTASAKSAHVLEDWGKPQRVIAAEIKAAKAAEAKAAALRAKAEKEAQRNQIASRSGQDNIAAPPGATASSEGAPAAGLAKSTIIDGVPTLTVTIPGGESPNKAPWGFTYTAPSRLGGPVDRPESGSAKTVDKRRFLHEAHAAACKIFETTLGPEANAAHRNHFHVDMAKRKRAIKICD